MKQHVKTRDDEHSKLQYKVDSLLYENKMLTDTNLNLVKGFDVLENDFKMKLRKLVSFPFKFIRFLVTFNS